MKIFVLILLMSAAGFCQEQGSVTIYRYKAHAGAWSKAPVYVDGVKVADVKNGAKIVIDLHPGKHTVNGKQKNRGEELNIEPGQQYFFRIENVPFGGLQLARVTAEQARFELAKLD